MVAVHEQPAVAGLMSIAVHGVTLLGDTWLKASPIDLVAPFFMSYKPGFTGLGVLAGWLAALLGLSFYARRWIGAKRWRSLHRATLLVWLMAAVHTLGAGTDAGSAWLQAVVVAPGRWHPPDAPGAAPAAPPARRGPGGRPRQGGPGRPDRRPAPRPAPGGPSRLAPAAPGSGPAAARGPGAARRRRPMGRGCRRRAGRLGPDRLVAEPAMTDGIVIAGGGLAAQRCAETLRARGHDGPIRIVCGEPELPYDRPPLSKELLAGTVDDAALAFRSRHAYAEAAVDLIVGDRAVRLRPAGRRLELASAAALPATAS